MAARHTQKAESRFQNCSGNGTLEAFTPNDERCRNKVVRVLLRSILCCVALGSVAAGAAAHEIPTGVTVQLIVKPDRERLQLLVRAPLEAMQDQTFPAFGAGYLDVANADRALRNAALVWLANDIELYEDGERLPALTLVAARASIPSDRSFASYDAARAHVLGSPLPAGTELVWQQALLDVLFEAPIESEHGAFAVRPALERLGLRVETVIRYVAPNGVERMFRVDGAAQLIELDPSWLGAALGFVRHGFAHILDGADHLLFLLCLVIPFRRDLSALVYIVTAFTVAHSVTLIGSAYGLAPDALWFAPLVETLIAASIFYMAVENVFSASLRARWMLAFGFGLIHGFGFSFALRNTLQFAGDHVLTALLSFNVGVELGQLVVLALLVPTLVLLARFVPERAGVIVLSVIVAHTAWHWMTDRFAALAEFPIGVGDVIAALAASGLRWIAAGLGVVAVAAWLARQLWRKRRWQSQPQSSSSS